MAYQIEPVRPLGSEIVRIARELLRDGSRAVSSADESLAERVHRGRITCKKVRTLLRLLRSEHRDFFERENRRLREAARGLAAFRDAEVLLATSRRLEPTGRLARVAVRELQRRLDAHRRSLLADKKGVEWHLAAFDRELRASLAAMARWQPKDRDFAAMEPEIAATYRHVRRLGKRLHRAARGKQYHLWRKEVKAFGYHCRLLREAWPEGIKPFAKEADRLGDLLGSEHDLTVLRQFVIKADDETGARRPTLSRRRILNLIDRQRRELRRQALLVGERIFAEKPKAYGKRLRRWWRLAQDAGRTRDEKSASD